MRIPRIKRIDPYQTLTNPIALGFLTAPEIDKKVKQVIALAEISKLDTALPNLLSKDKICSALNTYQTSFESIGRFKYIGASQFSNERALITYACLINKGAAILSDFVETKEKARRTFILGNYDDVNKLIDAWTERHGESLWALRVKAQTLVAQGKTSEANEVCQNAHRRCPSPLIRLIISRIQSVTVSIDANFALKTTILPLLREFEAANSSEFAALLAGMFCPFSMRNGVEISSALPALQLLPLVDLYDFLTCTIATASINPRTNDQIPVPEWISSIQRIDSLANDPQLVRALESHLEGVECTVSGCGLEILKKYETGNYDEAVSLFSKGLSSLINPVAYVNIIGKSYAYMGRVPSQVNDSPLQSLITAVAQIYLLEPNTSLAKEKISSLSVSLHHLGISSNILLCDIKASRQRWRGDSNAEAIAKLASIESNEYTPLTGRISGQSQRAAIKVSLGDAPSHRKLRREIYDAITKCLPPDKISEIMATLSIEDCLKKDYLETYSDYCITTNQLDQLVDFCADVLCDNPVASSCFPMYELVSHVDSKELSSLNAVIVAYSYVKDVDASLDVFLNEAFERYLSHLKVQRPSEALLRKESLSRQELVFYRDICHIGTLDCLSCFRNGDELNAERVAILDKLIDLNRIEAQYRRRELNELINKSIFDTAANTMHGAKIFVDDAAIKRKVFDDVRKLVSLFHSVPDDEPGIEDLVQLQIESTDVIESDTQPKRAIVKTARSATALKIWGTVKNAFIDDEKYGLDKALSTEVRHGFFSNQVRSKVEEYQLITERNDSGKYLPNEPLRQANPLVSQSIWGSIEESLGKFSDSFNRTIEKAESWMKVEGAESAGSDGISFSLTNIELDEIKQALEASNDPHKAIDAILGRMWVKVEAALETIRARLNGEFRLDIETAFSELVSNIEEAKGGLPLLELMERIRNAHAGFIADLDSVVAWFYRASSNTLPASGTEYLVNIAARAFERVNALNSVIELNVIGLSEVELHQSAAKPFVIALINIFDNCLMHSGLGRGTKIFIDGSLDRINGKVQLCIKNRLTQKRIDELTEQVIHRINERARSEESFSLLKSEGGSGTTKAYREIVSNLPSSDVFFFVEFDNFIVRIEYAI